jgi:hypothetical protein
VYQTIPVKASFNGKFRFFFLFYLVVMKCQFDSYPSPVIQWIKILQEYNQMILEENDPQVMEILTKEIGSTIYETQLTVYLFLFI